MNMLIARILSLFGGKWSPFAKTSWKQDVYICFWITVFMTAFLYVSPIIQRFIERL